jgi:hypothetical protein
LCPSFFIAPCLSSQKGKNWVFVLGGHIGGQDRCQEYGFGLVEECLIKGMLEFKEKFGTTRHGGRLAIKDKCEGVIRSLKCH